MHIQQCASIVSSLQHILSYFVRRFAVCAACLLQARTSMVFTQHVLPSLYRHIALMLQHLLARAYRQTLCSLFSTCRHTHDSAARAAKLIQANCIVAIAWAHKSLQVLFMQHVQALIMQHVLPSFAQALSYLCSICCCQVCTSMVFTSMCCQVCTSMVFTQHVLISHVQTLCCLRSTCRRYELNAARAAKFVQAQKESNCS